MIIYDQASRELRNIRITLIIMTILIALGSGNRTVTVENDEHERDLSLNYSNLVQLEDGHFGVLSGDTSYIDQEMHIYFYNKDSNQIEYRTSQLLNEFLD